jgi:hypothetical protein
MIECRLEAADRIHALELGCNKSQDLVEESTDLEKAFWV